MLQLHLQLLDISLDQKHTKSSPSLKYSANNDTAETPEGAADSRDKYDNAILAGDPWVRKITCRRK